MALTIPELQSKRKQKRECISVRMHPEILSELREVAQANSATVSSTAAYLIAKAIRDLKREEGQGAHDAGSGGVR